MSMKLWFSLLVVLSLASAGCQRLPASPTQFDAHYRPGIRPGLYTSPFGPWPSIAAVRERIHQRWTVTSTGAGMTIGTISFGGNDYVVTEWARSSSVLRILTDIEGPKLPIFTESLEVTAPRKWAMAIDGESRGRPSVRDCSLVLTAGLRESGVNYAPANSLHYEWTCGPLKGDPNSQPLLHSELATAEGIVYRLRGDELTGPISGPECWLCNGGQIPADIVFDDPLLPYLFGN